MIPSDEKIRAMQLRAMRAVEAETGIKVLNPDGLLRGIKKGIDEGLKLLSGVDSIARQKIASQSRKIQPGTREYDELYARYVSEERRRRGL